MPLIFRRNQEARSSQPQRRGPSPWTAPNSFSVREWLGASRSAFRWRNGQPTTRVVIGLGKFRGRVFCLIFVGGTAAPGLRRRKIAGLEWWTVGISGRWSMRASCLRASNRTKWGIERVIDEFGGPSANVKARNLSPCLRVSYIRREIDVGPVRAFRQTILFATTRGRLFRGRAAIEQDRTCGGRAAPSLYFVSGPMPRRRCADFVRAAATFRGLSSRG